MGLGQFLILLIVAGICGSLAQALVGYSRGGCLVSVVIGFIPWPNTGLSRSGP